MGEECYAEKSGKHVKACKDECPGGIGAFETKPRKVWALLNTMSPEAVNQPQDNGVQGFGLWLMMDESIKTVLSVSWSGKRTSRPHKLCRKAGKKEGRISSAGRKMKGVIALKGDFTKGSHLEPRKRGCGQGCGRRETGGGLLLQEGRCSPRGWTQLWRDDCQDKALFWVMGGWAGLFPDSFQTCSLCVPRCAGTIPS